MNITIIVILAVIGALVLLIAGLLFGFSRKLYQFENVIRSFVTPIDEKTGSPLAKVTESAADMIARSIMAQAKGFMLGLQSGQKRAETAIQADIAEGSGLGASPLGAVLESFPALKKTLRRNPQLIDMAMGYLSRKKGVAAGSSSDNGQQPKFKL